MARSIALVLFVAASACASGGSTRRGAALAGHPEGADVAWRALSLPGGGGGIGFDDIRYVPALDRVLIPAGHTGALVLLRPANVDVERVTGFSLQAVYRAGHDFGPTSADGGDGVVFVTDRTARALDVVDPIRKLIVSSTKLATKPDLVRYVEATNEVWVTEPDSERIEVLAVSAGPPPVAAHSAFIPAPHGPEGLTIDRTRGRAYTHLGETTVALDLKSRGVTARWSTGCASPSGLALDEARGLLFVGCSDGQVAVVDVSKDGAVARLQVGSSIDHIAFSPRSRHLYVPDTKSAKMTTFAVSQEGEILILGTIATVPGTECVTTDDRGHVYLCDPVHGRILVVADPYPANGHER